MSRKSLIAVGLGLVAVTSGLLAHAQVGCALGCKVVQAQASRSSNPFPNGGSNTGYCGYFGGQPQGQFLFAQGTSGQVHAFTPTVDFFYQLVTPAVAATQCMQCATSAPQFAAEGVVFPGGLPFQLKQGTCDQP